MPGGPAMEGAMHQESLAQWGHSHAFLGEGHTRNERKTWFVIALTATMMVAEITGGSLFGSMALVADGWHMSTHAAALAIAAFAYTYARRHAHDRRFAFGTGKLGDLAGFTSAVILALIALLIAYEAIQRLLQPVAIAFSEAVAVAALGLAVNIVSAWLLRDEEHHHHGAHAHHHDDDHDDDHDHDHLHDHDHHDHAPRRTRHRDNNLRAAYIHVMADAAISVLAISGLLLAWSYGWLWMDPLAGIIGALVIANWSYGLMRDTGRVLLDVTSDRSLAEDIRRRIEIADDRIADLHLWQIGPGHCGAIISVVAHDPQAPEVYKERLRSLAMLSHVTVEVHACG
jgi:cation diffusion facilitator family transporter